MDGPEGEHYWCVKKGEEWTDSLGEKLSWNDLRQTYELYMFGTILILPALIMTFTYCRICTHLWSIVHRRTAIRYGNACHVWVDIRSELLRERQREKQSETEIECDKYKGGDRNRERQRKKKILKDFEIPDPK